MTLPSHLSAPSAQGLAPGQPIAQFEIGSQRNFVYLVLDWSPDRSARRAAIVDPQRDLTHPLAALKEHGFTLETVLLTHTHSDHTAGVPELLKLFPKVALWVHEQDQGRLKHSQLATLQEEGRLHAAREGETLPLGQTRIQVLHTPGHSAGECCYLVQGARGTPPYLLTGDTLFIRDCGRTDLESGSTTQMFESLQKIKGLPPETVILPGHHYAPECASTLERELRESPPLRCESVAELENLP